MGISLNSVRTLGSCQAKSKRHNATPLTLSNYTPKNTGDYRRLPQPESSQGFDGWLKFEPVPESDSIDRSERYRIIYWGLRPEKGQQPQYWDYIGAGGQWYQHEIEEFQRQFEGARDKQNFVLKRLDNVLDAIAASAPSTVATAVTSEAAGGAA